MSQQPQAQPNPPYSPGLEGIIAGESAICQVNPDAGLVYRGYNIESIAARVSFEKVAWLLLEGELPTETEIIEFHNELTAASALPMQVVSMLHMLPKGMHPMDAIRTGISMLAGSSSFAAVSRECRRPTSTPSFKRYVLVAGTPSSS